MTLRKNFAFERGVGHSEQEGFKWRKRSSTARRKLQSTRVKEKREARGKVAPVSDVS